MLIVECKPDVTLAASLASISRKRVLHAGNKSRVLRRLIRNHKNSIGMIDQDPQSIQPPDMQRFREIEYSENNKLKILYHKSRNNLLLVLYPRLEEWIVEAAKEANMDLKKYNLSGDPTQLHEEINIRIEKFQKLVEKLKEKSNRVKELKARLKKRNLT